MSYDRLDGTDRQSLFPGKLIILTNGLIHSNKGIEYVIRAMPAVLKVIPNAMYLVCGDLQPNSNYEIYYDMLLKEAEHYAPNNTFFNKSFSTNEELYLLLRNAAVYINAYINRDQAVSGTLAMAIGTGAVSISTPYSFASEMLSPDDSGDAGGILIPRQDSAAISSALISILSNSKLRSSMSEAAYKRAREITWDKVARRYLDIALNITPN